MKRSYTVFLSAALVLSLLSWIGSADSIVVLTNLVHFKGLFSADREVRVSTEIDAIIERNEHIAELVRIVNEENIEVTNPDALVGAISLLGVYRARNAINPIARHLMFKPGSYSRRLFRAVPKQEEYPAVNALLSIGYSSDLSKLLIRRVSYSEYPLERELAAYVLGKVFGREQAKKAFFDAMSETSRKTSKEHYQEAIEFISNVSFRALPPKLTLPIVKE